MANWRRIRSLRNFLDRMEETPYKKFDMSNWITEPARVSTPAWEVEHGIRRFPTVRELRKNGESCGTAACLAGWVTILHDDPDARPFEGHVHSPILFAAHYLGLAQEEAGYMFHGNWSGRAELSKIKRREAVRYLDLVLEHKDIFRHLRRKGSLRKYWGPRTPATLDSPDEPC